MEALHTPKKTVTVLIFWALTAASSSEQLIPIVGNHNCTPPHLIAQGPATPLFVSLWLFLLVRVWRCTIGLHVSMGI